MRGHIKHALVEVGYPAEDLAGYVEGETLEIHLRPQTMTGKPFTVRHYQQEAAEVFYAGGADHGVLAATSATRLSGVSTCGSCRGAPEPAGYQT